MSARKDEELSTDTLHCRCKRSDKLKWEQAAKEANVPLSKWVIKTLNDNLKRDV